MYVHPCRHCPKFKECEQYQAALKTMRESPVKATGLRIICDGFPESIIPSGTRVRAEVNLFDGDEVYHDWRDGTVMGASNSRKDKLLVHFDDLEGRRDAIRHLYPIRLTVLSEPKAELCPGCDLPINITTRPPNWSCACDIKPGRRGAAYLTDSLHTKWLISLPYPCQTIAMVVKDL